jgi:hypothetical protein
LVRLHEDPAADIEAVSESYDVPLEDTRAALVELGERGLIAEPGVLASAAAPGQDTAGASDGAPAQDGAGAHTPTPQGEEIVEKLVAERRASLSRLCDGWSPEQHPDLAGLLTRLARELVSEPASGVGARA